MSYPAMRTLNPVIVFQLVPFSLLVVVLGVFGHSLNGLLQYQRTAVLAGEWWRLLSAHIVHLGMEHTLLNLAALLLILKIFAEVIPAKVGWLVSILLCLGISLCFVFLLPTLTYYAGLSGVIHGLLVFLVIVALTKKRLFKPLVLCFALAMITGKLIYEHTNFYSAGYIEQAMGAPVVVEAHLYGAVLGAIFAIGYLLINIQKKEGSS